jgi:uncharacterized membrane protein
VIALPADRRKAAAIATLGGFTALVGALHFAATDSFVPMMPFALAPWARELVWVSGFFEILGSVGLFVPRVRRAAAVGLVLLYIAVFPANIHMAVNHIGPGGMDVPAWTLWVRLPFQAVFIGLAAWFAKSPD